MSHIFKEIEKGNVASIKKILSVNPSIVNLTTETDNRTPLHVAALAGQSSIVQYLLMFETKYDSQDSAGNTPLHLACKSGGVETVRPLLSSGRKTALRVRNKDGQTPLHYAVKFGNTNVVKELLSMGAKTDLKDKEGNTALDLLPEDCRELIPALSESTGLINNGSKHMYYVSTPKYITHSSPKTTSRRNSITSLDRSITSSPPLSTIKVSLSPDKGTPAKPIQTSRTGRKHLQLHEVAIQGLQSELQDLGSRVDNIEEIFDDNQEIFDCANRFYLQVETQDRQLAELDQRLKFQEAHMRELRPQVSTLSDETRYNKDQNQYMKKMIDLWKDTVRDTMDKVEQRIKEWENNTSRWSDEERCVEVDLPDPEHEIRDELRNLEKQVADATLEIKEVKTSMSNNASCHSNLECKIEEVQSRLVHVESMLIDATNKRREREKQEDAQMRQIMDLTRKLERLQVFVDKTASHVDRVETLYTEQMRLENSRKAEQERELSQRESRIIDLRKMALEEEQQRRDLFVEQDQQRTLLETLMAKLEAIEVKADEDEKECELLREKIKELEDNHNDFKEKVMQQELRKKNKKLLRCFA